MEKSTFSKTILASLVLLAVVHQVTSTPGVCTDGGSTNCAGGNFATGTCENALTGEGTCACQDTACTCSAGYILSTVAATVRQCVANGKTCTSGSVTTDCPTSGPYDGTCSGTPSVCACKTGYETKEGACRLKAPTVSQPTGRTLQVVSGSSAVMTCTPLSDVPAGDIVGYTWTVDGSVVAGQTAATYTLTSITANKAVACSLTHATADYNSVTGAATTLTVLTGSSETLTLTIVNPTMTNADGTFTPQCNGLPIGQDPQYQDESSSALTTFMLPAVPSGKSYKCVVPASVSYVSAEQSSAASPYPAAGKYCTVATQSTDCAGTGYSGTCTSATSRCACSASYTAKLTVCLSDTAVGPPCVSNTYCTTPAAALTGTCSNNLCACNSGYHASGTSCLLNGLACTADTQCDTGNTAASDTPYGTCDTTTSRCNCATGYYTSDAACILTGKACTTANQATECNGDKYSGTCTNDRCVCAEGYTKVDGDCNGSTAVTASILLLLTTFFVSRLF